MAISQNGMSQSKKINLTRSSSSCSRRRRRPRTQAAGSSRASQNPETAHDKLAHFGSIKIMFLVGDYDVLADTWLLFE